MVSVPCCYIAHMLLIVCSVLRVLEARGAKASTLCARTIALPAATTSTSMKPQWTLQLKLIAFTARRVNSKLRLFKHTSSSIGFGLCFKDARLRL